MAATRVEITEGGKDLTPPRCCVAHAWLDREIHDELVLQANRRRMHPDALVAALIDTVLDRRLIPALLDRG